MPPIDGQEVNSGRDGIGLVDSVEPGILHKLPQNYDFTPFNPDYPRANYDAFVKAGLRDITSSLNMAYHNLVDDFGSVNFSGIHSGALEKHDT